MQLSPLIDPSDPGELAPYAPLLDAPSLLALERAVARPLVPAIRLNTLKVAPAEARAAWPARYGWTVEPVPFCPTGWRVPAVDPEQATVAPNELSRTPEFKLGAYYIQDAASMLPVELFPTPTGPLLTLDLAAAPGGKTTHLIDRLGDRGLVVANDSSANRIPPLRANLQDWSAANVVVTNYLGELWGGWYPETFDWVLLDAPCSGESLRTAERHRARSISDRERQALQAQQIRLLVSAFQALRPGGELVYATCTLHPDEDEAVLDALLARYPTAAAIVSIDLVDAPALSAAGERHFHPDVRRAARLWPHLYDTSGFFAARIHKQASVRPEGDSRPSRPLSQRNLRPLNPAERSALIDQLEEDYGFDLQAVLARQELSLWRRHDQLVALPEPYLAHFGDLPVISAGMLLAEEKGCELTPSHEFVSRFGRHFLRGRLVIPAAQAHGWLQGQELRGRHGAGLPRRAVVLVTDELGRMLGRGKLLDNRVRNLLPRRLCY
jgi:16S rRNA (cytosine1407-C5)-methyltransferase